MALNFCRSSSLLFGSLLLVRENEANPLKKRKEKEKLSDGEGIHTHLCPSLECLYQITLLGHLSYETDSYLFLPVSVCVEFPSLAIKDCG